MIVQTVVVTEFMTNCFIIGDEQSREGLVIDPGGESKKILDVVAELQLNVVGIVNTHGHVDHVGADNAVKQATGAPVMLHQADEPVFNAAAQMGRMFGVQVQQPDGPDRWLSEGDEVFFGSRSLKVMETPGHSPGGISLVLDEGGVCFAGDTLFAGSIGRTDLPGGDYETLIRSIKQRLLPLGDDCRVLPGHGPATTIGQERQFNPFL